jgi:hypothetical protein
LCIRLIRSCVLLKRSIGRFAVPQTGMVRVAIVNSRARVRIVEWERVIKLIVRGRRGVRTDMVGVRMSLIKVIRGFRGRNGRRCWRRVGRRVAQVRVLVRAGRWRLVVRREFCVGHVRRLVIIATRHFQKIMVSFSIVW